MEKNFDRRLKALLSENCMPRAELARRLGVTVPVVSRWLNGASAPDVYQVQAVARLFGLPCAWFLDGRDGMPAPSDMAALLGLSGDTVCLLMELAENEPEEVLDAVDDAVYAVINATRTAREV